MGSMIIGGILALAGVVIGATITMASSRRQPE